MASPIETMFYIFDADAKKLEAGLDKADKQAKNVEQSIERVDKAASAMGASFLELVKGFGAGIVAGLAASSIGSLVKQTAELATQSLDAAEALGVQVDQLEALDSAAQMSGGQQGALSNSLRSLTLNLQEVARTGKGAAVPALVALGVSLDQVKQVADDPIAAMELLADQFENLSAAEAAQLGAKLGLDQGTINLLRQGRAGMADLVAEQKELFTLTKKDAEAAAAFQDQLDRLMRVVEGVKRTIATMLMPALTWALEKITETVKFLQDHKAAAISFFAALAAIVLAIFLPSMIAAAAAVWATIAPFVAVGIAVLALAAIFALVAEDVWNFYNGQDSVIGELSKKWPVIGEIVKDLGLVFQWWGEIVTGILQFIADAVMLGPGQAFENLKARVFAVFDSIGARFPILSGGLEALKGVINSVGETFSGVWAKAKEGADKLLNILGAVFNALKPIMEGAAKLLGLKMPSMDAVKSAFTGGKSTAEAQADAQRALSGNTATNIGAATAKAEREKAEGKKDDGPGIFESAAAKAKGAFGLDQDGKAKSLGYGGGGGGGGGAGAGGAGAGGGGKMDQPPPRAPGTYTSVGPLVAAADEPDVQPIQQQPAAPQEPATGGLDGLMSGMLGSIGMGNNAAAAIASANANPFTAATSPSMGADQGAPAPSKTITVTIEQLTVQTQAASSEEIGQQISGQLIEQINRAINNADDGELA